MIDQPPADMGIGEVESVRDELDAALRAAGVALPSLTLDPLSFAGSVPLPLISLGRCNLATARALICALHPRPEAPEEAEEAGAPEEAEEPKGASR